MRQIKRQQLNLGETDISQIQFDPKSRDEIPQLLRGIQYIYVSPEIRQEVFQILKTMIPSKIDIRNGRQGMDLWKIFVLGALRLNLNCDFDHLHEMANQHKTLRQILGHGLLDDKYTYKLQTLKDNIYLLTPEILDKINQVVVKTGHTIVNKNDEALRGRCDSFVLETDVHFPTDINLLFDAIRKVITLIAQLSESIGRFGWRQHIYNIRQVKKLYRQVQKLNASNSKDTKKKEEREELIRQTYQSYLNLVDSVLQKANETLETIDKLRPDKFIEILQINHFVSHAKRQTDQIQRRVMNEEIIPHDEKVFSIFQEHTEWICKGKAGVLVELGVRVCIMEDQYGFILHHHVMQKTTDDKVAVSMVKETQGKFPELGICSFDKGFHSPSNQKELRELLHLCVLPKKGKLSLNDKDYEYSEEFKKIRRNHSAVESAINALEVHGLDKCPDHGIQGLKRYVALAVLARNIQKLGTLLQKKEAKAQKRQKIFKVAA